MFRARIGENVCIICLDRLQPEDTNGEEVRSYSNVMVWTKGMFL